MEQPSQGAPPKIDVRQQLAADRTILAWIRTSFTLAGLGFVVARFHLLVSASTTSWHQARVLGVALVAVSVVIAVLGLHQYLRVTDLLRVHGDAAPSSPLPAVAASVLTLLVLVALCVYLAAGVR